VSHWWEIVELNSTPYYLELRHPDGWYEARVNYDGCFEFIRAHNHPLPEQPEPTSQMINQIHICEIDDLIAQLTDLKRLAFARFGDEFWSDGVNGP
jgi:hypothetical protein